MMEERKCLYCGKELERRRSGQRGPLKNYCNNKCKDKYRQDRIKNNRQSRKCLHCDKILDDNHNKYCSPTCRNKPRLQKICDRCGSNFLTNRNTQIYCSSFCRNNRGSVKFAYVCVNCKRTYWTHYKNRNQYCSRECAFDARRPVEWRKVIFIDKVIKKTISKCALCGEVYEKRNGAHKYCSKECQYEASKNKLRERLSKERAAFRMMRGFTRKICPECGKDFIINFRPEQRIYCSNKCCDRAYRHNQNVFARWKKYSNRLRSVKHERINKAMIFKRDNYRCRLCGKKVNMKLKWPDPMCATLDHILPIANGGEHKDTNLQLAHFICNSKKSNIKPDQLRLM